VVVFIDPLRERQACWCFVIGWLMMVVLFPLGFLSTTVLTKPAIAEVKEVSGLMHNPHGELWSATACRRFCYRKRSQMSAVTKRRQAVALQS
jgi:hypothetical protein